MVEKEKNISQVPSGWGQMPAHRSQPTPSRQGSAQGRGDLNKDMVDYGPLICIMRFCILRFPSVVCYWMAVLAQSRSQNGSAGSTEWPFFSPGVHLRVIILQAKKKKKKKTIHCTRGWQCSAWLSFRPHRGHHGCLHNKLLSGFWMRNLLSLF